MSIPQRMGAGLDSLISIFSPAWAGRRQLARHAFSASPVSGRFAAGGEDRLNAGWRPVSGNINDLISRNHDQVTARVRQLTRDFPFFARAVTVLVDLTVGGGIRVQSRVKTGSVDLDKKINDEHERFFEMWMDQADASGQLHFHEMCRLARKTELETGEFLFFKDRRRSSGRQIPYALQAIDPTRLTDSGAKPHGTNVVRMGVEISPSTGIRAAYHISDEGYGKPSRVPARDIIHVFDPLAAGQLRGISPLTPGVLLAHDLGDLIDSTLDTARLASKYLAFVKTPDIAGRQMGRVRPDPADATKKIESMENAIIEYLRPGEEISLSSADVSGANFDPFVRLLLRMLAVATGCSYELLTGDYSGLSFSNYKGIRTDMYRQTRPHQDRMIRRLYRVAYQDAVTAGVMSGALNRPRFFSDTAAHLAAIWMPPGLPPVDPLKEGKADVSLMEAFLKSPQEIILSRGRDAGEVLDEIQDFKKMAEIRGLDYATAVAGVSTATANNPAALGVEE